MKLGVKTRLISFLLLLLFLFSLVSCADEVEDPKPQNRIFYDYFNTVSVLYDYSGMSAESFSSLASSVEAAMQHYHKLFDAYIEYSGVTNIATLNRMGGKGAVKVPRELCELLSFSLEMYELTGGAVNFAMGAVTRLWKNLPASENRIPTDAELREAAEHISPYSVIIDKDNATVEITDPDLFIDVGAIAKGYAAELLKKELEAIGYSGIVLDMGGNLCAVGSKPSGKGWSSGIKNPLYPSESSEPYSRTVTLNGDSLVTSGVYERYYVIDGVKYHHIIDPETLKPEYRYLSVTIQSPTSGVSDALSTAIFNMTPERAREFVSSYEGKLEVTLVFPDGSVEVLK